MAKATINIFKPYLSANSMHSILVNKYKVRSAAFGKGKIIQKFKLVIMSSVTRSTAVRIGSLSNVFLPP